MTVVAIHQPNYAPWLGYFYKMSKADHFVFLDDVQFSKGSYINRTRILSADGGRWLTEPVSVTLGQAINEVTLSKPGWAQSHLDTLRGTYADAPAFASVWDSLQEAYAALPAGDLATVNRALIETLADKLKLTPALHCSSDFDTGDTSGDDRLIAIVNAIAPGATYLSGKGGAKYQDPEKFTAAGMALLYTDFDHPAYPQNADAFIPGLSVLDALFHLGFDETASLLAA